MVTGVPAGMADGASEPVGEIPPLSEVASKGRCWSALTFSTAVGRLSRCEHPASVNAMSAATRTMTGMALRQFPFDFIKQSCGAPALLHKSQDGCHRRRSIYQRLSGGVEIERVVIAGIIALASGVYGNNVGASVLARAESFVALQHERG